MPINESRAKEYDSLVIHRGGSYSNKNCKSNQTKLNNKYCLEIFKFRFGLDLKSFKTNNLGLEIQKPKIELMNQYRLIW